MVQRRDIVKVVVSLLAITVSGALIGLRFLPASCSPDEEEAILLATLNALPEVVEKGGKIDKVTRQLDGDEHDDVYRYEAEILNQEGVAIGRLRGGRVEGFGTMKPRIHWYKTPGVPEEMPERERRGRRWRDRN